MIKKSLIALGMVACFCLATMFSINSSEAQLTKEGEYVQCYCSQWNNQCKASNAGSGQGALCASGSESNPNVQCRDYDGNC